MKKIICIMLSVIVLLSVSACRSKTKKYTDYSFDYFDTVTTIVGYEKNEENFKKNCEQIKSLLSEYHKLYDIYNSYEGINNLCTVNLHKEVFVDSKIIDLLKFSKEMYQKTNGKLNIAMGSVLKIWHDYREEGKNLPSEDILKNANEHTDIENLRINGNTVFLADSEMFLDVGAVAKGYTAQKISLWMRENGLDGYVLNIGGNVCAIGSKQGKKWEVGIENPDDTTNFAEILHLDGQMSLVTSGSYQRFYTVDGKNYHHIIDPKTLMPANYFKSVSVLCDDSALADALSTALFCMSYEDGISLLKNFKNINVLWITNDSQKLFTEGFKNS